MEVPEEESDAPRKWAPHVYQRKAVKFLLSHGAAALFLDPGLGKTSITYAAGKVLLKEKVSRGVVVFAPLRPTLTTWPKEAALWTDFNDLSVAVLHGKDKEKLVREKHDFYIVNYEAIPWLFTRRKVNKVWKYELTEAGKALMANVDTIVFDELSKMKHANTLRFTLIRPWIKKFQRRWGLTGSPASNGLLDLFGQCYVLDEGNALGAFITHYRAQYFDPVDKMGYTWRVRHGCEELIYKRLKPLALRMEATDYLELPTRMDHVIKFDLPPAVRKQYKELEDDLLTNVRDDLIVAANAGAANSKCRQICSGALYLPDVDPITGVSAVGKGKDRRWAELHTEKLDALVDLVEELQGQQLLVAYYFNHDLERLLRAFPNTPYIGGGVSAKRGQELETAWNRGALSLLFGHPNSIGHGLNLQGSNAHHIAHFTLTWDFEEYDQYNKRLLRQGNKADYIHVYHFIARDTVDESVMYALRRKRRTQQDLLDALKGRKRVRN
jgi:SNF2 family DNA or RNA helicase